MKKDLSAIYNQSLENPKEFWGEVAKDVFWFKKPTKILNKSKPPFYKWFEDGTTTPATTHLIFILIMEKETRQH